MAKKSSPATDIAEARHESGASAGKDGARSRAGAPDNNEKLQETEAISGDLIPANGGHRALAPEVGRVDDRQFIRENGIEMTYNGDRGFGRDIDLARHVIGLAKPRGIRERIKAMLSNGDLRKDQVLTLVDDDVVVYYVDQDAATTLAFRSSKTDPLEIARRMFSVRSAFDSAAHRVAPMSAEKALAGYNRTIDFLDRKTASRAAKLAKLPLLEKYARASGLPMPDVSELIGHDQPRLDGV